MINVINLTVSDLQTPNTPTNLLFVVPVSARQFLPLLCNSAAVICCIFLILSLPFYTKLLFLPLSRLGTFKNTRNP
ncbi:hypothetical protein FRX31_026736 [Thalictrum thalictroides]|uniref:Uncharacterized protein n=1 Tax=Thalictrum thalictroides TaxID=46969 RepID=A0A7J6VEY6_THATH|nr:hypothetical protein FRX31_026736 [Thalictrum thalictroides]